MKEVFYKKQPKVLREGLNQNRVYDFSAKQARRRYLNLSASSYQKSGAKVNKSFRKVLKDEARKVFLDEKYQYRLKDGNIYKLIV